MTPQCVVAAENLLGEGPIWHAGQQALYWVDIAGRAIWRLDGRSGETTRWTAQERPSALAFEPGGRLLVARGSGVARFTPANGAWEPVADIEPDRPDNRCNDGACDRRGRFWIGTMDDTERTDNGGLYRVDSDGTVTRMLDGIGISNTVAWSPDDTTMYFGDSRRRTVWALPFDAETGTVGDRRVFAKTDAHDGVPDGSTVDAEGGVWTCIWDGGRVVRHTPDGVLDRTIELPVARPTSCTFGGPDLDTLYITSARIGLTGYQPHAGGLFTINPGIAGLPEPVFGSHRP